MFEAHGATITNTDEAARAKAREIWRRLVAEKRAAKKR